MRSKGRTSEIKIGSRSRWLRRCIPVLPSFSRNIKTRGGRIKLFLVLDEQEDIMRCIKCGSPGPFYASQSHCYCIPCHKAACKRTPAQTAHTRALRQARTVRALLRLRDTDADALTRRQHLRLLRLNCPPYKKV